MKMNEGTVDRAVRAILGIILILVGFFVVEAKAGRILGVIGIVLLFTGVVGYCALYSLLHIDTTKRAKG